MKAPVQQSALSLRLLNTTKLPHLCGEPGPLHTILLDEQQNIYYSDEINHSLVSLDNAGKVRWHRSRLGKDPGEFHYPKGIELGWINQKGEKTDCVAVCDSWNRRIQFFDPNGNWLATWDRAGEVCFQDVVDIRFLPANPDSVAEGFCWLILDRGHHALFGLDISGKAFFRMGRPFPESLESNWATPGDASVPNAPAMDRIRQCLPYDPLFMPLRIFGNTWEALFVWEPKSRRIKQAISGNFFPVSMELPAGAEWIDANHERLLSFDRSAGILGVYDDKSGVQTSFIEGTPVPAGRTSNEVWIQNGTSIHRWILNRGEAQQGNARPWVLCPFLQIDMH